MATSYDLESHGPIATVRVTETVAKGGCFMIDSSNHWPYVLESTGDTVQSLGTFLADGVSGDYVPALLNGYLVTCTGTATEGSPIAPAASGAYQVCAAGDICVGMALESATATTFLALMTGVNAVVKA